MKQCGPWKKRTSSGKGRRHRRHALRRHERVLSVRQLALIADHSDHVAVLGYQHRVGRRVAAPAMVDRGMVDRTLAAPRILPTVGLALDPPLYFTSALEVNAAYRRPCGVLRNRTPRPLG